MSTPILDGNSTLEQIATDDVAGVKHQQVKMEYGDAGTATMVSATNPLPTTLGSAVVPVSDGGGLISVDDGGGSLTVDDGGGSITVDGTVAVSTAPAASVATDSVGAAPLAEVTLAGATPFTLVSAASTNATSVKASTGKVYAIVVSNVNAAIRYLKLYNKASAPTVGTDVPVFRVPIPGNTAGAGAVVALPMPLKFSAGIALALTTGVADADTGAVAANDISVSLAYI